MPSFRYALMVLYHPASALSDALGEPEALLGRLGAAVLSTA